MKKLALLMGIAVASLTGADGGSRGAIASTWAISTTTASRISGWPGKGFEVQVNNTFVKDPKKTGSLYQVVDIHDQLVKDNEWFTEYVMAKGNTITV